jgi:pilus assembly protein CpaC
VLGQGRLLTLKSDIGGPRGSGVVAVGDPTILEFDVLPNPRMLRLIGRRVGVTDLSITTAQGDSYSFEVTVGYDIPVLRAQLREAFPDAEVRLAQLREHLIVEGEAHSPAQIQQIVRTLEAYLQSVQVPQETRGREEMGRPLSPSGGELPGPAPAPLPPSPSPAKVKPTAYSQPYAEPAEQPRLPGEAVPGPGGRVSTKATFAKPQIINLLRVVGLHQVMLKVRIAELNRTATREIGADILGVHPGTGNIFGTSIGGATIAATSLLGLGGLTGTATGASSPSTTAFGIFPSGDFEILLHALRRNSLLSILAEPNLVAMDGHQASFLAGGQFPVPVAQSGAGIGSNPAITIEWKDFGVQLNFVPNVIDDQTIRLKVAPEASSIDQALGTRVAGTDVPGIITRKADTTVELHQGETLAIAGLLQVTMDGTTRRIPLLGDLPYIGPLFSNTSHSRAEKELLVMVTPYLVKGMSPEQVGPEPGAEVKDPTDWEFYLMNRIEGRTGRDFRSTIHRDDPGNQAQVERKYISGPVGYSNQPEPKPSR